MDTVAILLSGVPSALTDVTKTELDELDAEDVTETQPLGESSCRVVLSGARHPEVHLGEQDHVRRHRCEEGGGRVEELRALCVPGRDPNLPGGAGRPFGGRADFDAVQRGEARDEAMVGITIVRAGENARALGGGHGGDVHAPGFDDRGGHLRARSSEARQLSRPERRRGLPE